MPHDGRLLLAGYRELDAALVAAGRHPTSPPFLETLTRFWLSGRRRLVLRKGRQSGASTTFARVAVATGCFGEHRAPPGTRLTIPFVSVRMSEASERLRNIEDALAVLSEPYRRRDDTIELTARGIIFQAYPCSFRRAVGMTSAALFEDEVARWWSDEALANPAAEVDAAMVPSLATQPNGRVYTCSSPMGFDDLHAELMARGDTDDQCVADGPSWYWNPTITERDTHALMPDERRWRREFAAIPQAGALSAFDHDAVVRAFATPLRVGPTLGRVGIVDASSGKKDTFAFGVCGWRDVDDRRRLVFDSVDGFEGPFFKQRSGEDTVRQIAHAFKKAGVRHAFGDQRESYMLGAAFARHGIKFTETVWSAPTKERAVASVRRFLADGLLVLPEHAQLRRELFSFEERITPSGAFTFGARGSGHDDYVSKRRARLRCVFLHGCCFGSRRT